MALLIQDFGNFNGLSIWVELQDDSLRAKDQTTLHLFVKNENREVNVRNIEIKLYIKPQGPAILPDLIAIESLVPGRTIRETLILQTGDSASATYSLRMGVDFQLVPATWVLSPLPFQVQ